MYSYWHLHMAKQKQGDQLEPTYSSSVRIRGVALRTCRKRWTIGRGGERGSGISVQIAWHDDDDNYLLRVLIIIKYLKLCANRLLLLSSLSNRFYSQLGLQNTQTFSLQRVKTPPTSPEMTLNNLVVRYHLRWMFEECGETPSLPFLPDPL